MASLGHNELKEVPYQIPLDKVHSKFIDVTAFDY